MPRQRARIFADVLGYPTESILLKPDLYETDVDTVFDVVLRKSTLPSFPMS